MINKVLLTWLLQMSLTLSKMVDKVEVLRSLAVSGHISLNITHVLYTESSINHTSFNYFEGNFVSLRSIIKDANLTNCVQACDTINDKWDCFHKTIADDINIFVPVKRKSSIKNKK